MKNPFLFLVLFLTTNKPISYQPTFAYPAQLIGEPRITKDWLSTFELSLRGGHSEDGHNGCKQVVNALNIYGCENLYKLAKGVPDCILDCDPNGYINTLWETTPRKPNFGQVLVKGKFNVIEFTPAITQNLKYGFFFSLTFPIIEYSIKGVTYYDQTTKDSAPSDRAYFEWQQFINNVECNLQKYGLNVGDFKISGLEDIQIMGGWSHNFENFKRLDFLDITLCLGVNVPTGKNPKPTDSFAISPGYNGHWGLPFILRTSLGLFDWFTLGINGGAMWFKNKKRCLEMKTAYEQSGWIRMARDYANVDQGTIWTIESFIKADHLIGGFSVRIAFSHDHQNKTTLSPCNTSLYDKTIVNTDPLYASWSMTSFLFALDFDFASFKHTWAPRLVFTIEKAICGKRIFDSALFGATIACDIEW